MTVHTRGASGFGRHVVGPSDRGDDWRDFAACRDHEPELWFPVGEPKPGGKNTVATEIALGICFDCPVLLQCREYAISSKQDHGVWGGMDEAQLHQTQRKYGIRK